MLRYQAGRGGLRKPRVLRYSTEEPSDDSRSYGGGDSRETSTLSALVHSHRYRLRRALKDAAAAEPGSLPKHRISVEGWAAVMGEVLRLEKVNFLALQPALAPTIQRFVPNSCNGELVDTGTVNYRHFLTEMEQQMGQSPSAAALADKANDGGDSGMTRGQDVATLGAL